MNNSTFDTPIIKRNRLEHYNPHRYTLTKVTLF